MSEADLDRRRFLASGLAGGVLAWAGPGVYGALPEGPMLLKPFTHSPTVSLFAHGMFWCGGGNPPLLLEIEAQLERAGNPIDRYELWRPAADTGALQPDRPVTASEHQRAAFFARLAVEHLAPRALRHAGYEEMAVDVASGALDPAEAQHMIGRQYRDCSVMQPLPASGAYGTCAHASTTALRAAHRELGEVAQAGYYCARALESVLCLGDEDVLPDDARVWDFAARAINLAIDLIPDVEAGQVPA